MYSQNMNAKVERYNIGDIKSKVLQIIEINDGKKNRWAIVDTFGNIVTPFFENYRNAVQLAENSCILLGRENGENALYRVTTKSNDVGECVKLPTIGEPTYFKIYNNGGNLVMKVETREGEYFACPLTDRVKSDIYKKLYFDYDLNTWLYDLEVRHFDERTILTGPIDMNGRVGDRAYDNAFDKVRPIRTNKRQKNFDVINTKEVSEDLLRRQEEKIKQKDSAVRSLVKSKKKSSI